MKNTQILTEPTQFNKFTTALKRCIELTGNSVNVKLRNGSAASVIFHSSGAAADMDDCFFEEETLRGWHLSGKSFAARCLDIVEFEPIADIAPISGSVWRHKNGNRYKVVCVANLESTRPDEYPVTVVYQGESGVVWSRPLDAWYGSMTQVE